MSSWKVKELRYRSYTFQQLKTSKKLYVYLINKNLIFVCDQLFCIRSQYNIPAFFYKIQQEAQETDFQYYRDHCAYYEDSKQ